MKKSILTITALTGLSISHASTISENALGLYQGEEQINERSTGKIYYLYIDNIQDNPVGRHCYNLTTRPIFSTDHDSHPKDEIKVQSHITNYHRLEYPKTKTCVTSLDGKTSGDDIYGDETTIIYNQLFSWASKFNGYQFDFFVTFSPMTKLPSRTRLHRMSTLSEKNYDCVKLQKNVDDKFK